MENEFTVERAMQAPSVEALLALARENGIILPIENAQELYVALHGVTGELSDEALDAVSGGCVGAPITCPKCHTKQVGIAWRDEWRYECLNEGCATTWKSGR